MSAGSYSPMLPRFTLKNFLARNAQMGTCTKKSTQCPMRSSRRTTESWTHSFGTFHCKSNCYYIDTLSIFPYFSYKIKFVATLLGVEVVTLEVGERDEKINEDEEQEGGHQ